VEVLERARVERAFWSRFWRGSHGSPREEGIGDEKTSKHEEFDRDLHGRVEG
jgi:hypothetical protein